MEDKTWALARLEEISPDTVTGDAAEWEITLSCESEEKFLNLVDDFIKEFTGVPDWIRLSVETGIYQEDETAPIRGYWVSVTVRI